MLPSNKTSIGIVISAYTPFSQGRRHLLDITNYSSYSHEVLANGGYWTASIGLTISLEYAEEWFESGLGREIRVLDMQGVTIWQGVVNKVSINAGPVTQTRGPLFDIGNRVSAIYTPRDFSVYPPVDGTETTTIIVEDTTSQGLYGIIEKIISAGTTSDANAEKIRDVFLEDNSEPQTTGDLSFSPGSSQSAQVTLDCVGLAYWLTAFVYNDTSTGLDTLYNKLTMIMAADPNGIISTDYSQMSDNTYLTPLMETGNRFAWDIIVELLGLGNDSDDSRRTFGIYKNGVAKYQAIDMTPFYIYRISDGNQRILTLQNTVVMPWDIQPGRWIQATDFLIGRVSSTTRPRSDPRMKFIESVKYTAPWTVDLSGGKTDRLSQMLAKISYSGGFL